MNTLEFLNETYLLLHRYGLVGTKADFSTTMLGKTRSYLTSMSARNRHPPLAVISFLRAVLQVRLHSFRASPHFAQPYAETLNLANERLEAILNVVSAYEEAAGRGEISDPDTISNHVGPQMTVGKIRVFEWLQNAISMQSPPRI